MNLTDLAARFVKAGLMTGETDVADIVVTGVADDSRAVVPGSVFLAVAGTGADGHAFIDDALQRGAAALVVSQPVDGRVPALHVTDGRRAAAIAAAAAAGDPADTLRVVAVTGTNGKSTVVWMLHHLLNKHGDVGALGTLGGFDGSGDALFLEGLTTPGPIALHEHLAALRQRGCETVVMEASSHALDQQRLYGVPLRVGVFTNMTHDHLDYHTTFEAYRRAKYALVEHIQADGVQVVNAADAVWSDLPLPTGQRRISFGPGADVSASEVVFSSDGCEGTLSVGQQEHRFLLPLIGQFNVDNMLAAVATGLALDVEVEPLLERLQSMPQVPGRMERISGEPFVLRDYAHTPDALERAIAAARPLTSGRLLVLFGCGGDRDVGKRPAMGRIATRDADLAILTSDNPRTEDPERILDDIAEGIDGHAYLRIADRREAIRRGVAMMHGGDCLLLAGKGHETYQVLGHERVPFDEREIVTTLVSAST